MIYSEQAAKIISYQTLRGYWKVGSNCFFDKGDCLRFASFTKTHTVTFHFFDEVYRGIDWSTEPRDSLDSLYADRARQLRDKYDYVALLCSGGADSTNVLQTFLKNNIKVDEVLCYYPVAAARKRYSLFNREDKDSQNQIFEYFEAAVPLFEWIAKHKPEIKLTVLDFTGDTLDVVARGKITELNLCGMTSNGITIGQYNAFKHLRSKGGKACLVAGVDKPRLRYDRQAKKFHFFFLDFNNLWGNFPTEVFNGDHPIMEFFYFSPDAPTIVVKQSHEIKKVLSQIEIDHQNHLFPGLFVKLPEPFASRYVGINSHSDIIKQILYSGWDTRTYQASKPKSLLHNHGHNSWLLDYTTHNNKNIRQYFYGQMDELISGIGNEFLEFDEVGKPSKLRQYFTAPIIF